MGKKNKKKLSKKNNSVISENLENDLFPKIISVTREIVSDSNDAIFDEIETFKDKKNKKIVDTKKSKRYEEIVEVNDKLFKVKSNHSRTTIIPGINVSMNNNESLENISKKPFHEVDDLSFLENSFNSLNKIDSITNESFTFSSNLKNKKNLFENKNNEITTQNECHNTEFVRSTNYLNDLENNNLDPFKSSSNNDNNIVNDYGFGSLFNTFDEVKNDESIFNLDNEIVKLSNFKNINDFDNSSQNNEFVKNTTSQLKALSSKIDSLILETKEIKETYFDQQQEELRKTMDLVNSNKEVVPPPFINVPIPHEKHNHLKSFTKNIKK